MKENIILVGCGKMGNAILEGWVDCGIHPERIYVVEPNKNYTSNLTKRFNVKCTESHSGLSLQIKPRVVLFAVKPQILDTVVPNYTKFHSSNSIFLSIAAGKTTQYFEEHLAVDAAIIRAMPNTPASIRRGITVAYANAKVRKSERAFAETLLAAVGKVEWVENENMMDAVTALSGGGPAYVFLLVECLSQAGIDLGLPRTLSKRLARATVSGAGELLNRSSEEPSTLRQNVTSPGGTTAEALKILMGNNAWQAIISQAIAAATKKSRELAI